MRESRIADRARPRVEHPFGADVHLVLRAIGDSMIDDGILPNDTLYAIAPDATTTSAIGKIIACRIHDAVFAKRLVSEHGRRFLVSANPRYRAIAIDADDLRFEILGVVIGRLGRID
jgi:SOS-response transcriptional repressor LexA